MNDPAPPDFDIFYGGVLLPDVAHNLALAYSHLSAKLEGSDHDLNWEWFIRFKTCCERHRTCESREARTRIECLVALLAAHESELREPWKTEFGERNAEWMIESLHICLNRMLWATPANGRVSWIGVPCKTGSHDGN